MEKKCIDRKSVTKVFVATKHQLPFIKNGNQ